MSDEIIGKKLSPHRSRTKEIVIQPAWKTASDLTAAISKLRTLVSCPRNKR
jgi:hypothetical protein